MRKTWSKEELIAFEDNIQNLYLDNKIPAVFHMSGGNEEQLIEIFKEIDSSDYVLGSHRSHYHFLLHGGDPDDLTNRIINGQSMFLYNRNKNFLNSAIIGGTPAIAAGIALALKKKGSKQKVWCFVGDGTEDNGHLFEAARYVEGFDLPCTFVIESNNMSIAATNEDRWGKTAHITWPFKCVRKYSYKFNRWHIRAPGMVDLSKLQRKTDEEYFPLVNYTPFSFKSQELNLSYKDAMPLAMEELAQNDKTIFLGYNVGTGKGEIMGSVKNVKDEQKLEMPVAENLMAGMAVGLALEGYRPVVYFERHDFMTVGMDAMINHLDKIERLSHGQYKAPVIIRAVAFDSSPFYSGPTHSQDFTNGLRELFQSIPVLEPKTGEEALEMYRFAGKANHPTLIIDRKSLY